MKTFFQEVIARVVLAGIVLLLPFGLVFAALCVLLRRMKEKDE